MDTVSVKGEWSVCATNDLKLYCSTYVYIQRLTFISVGLLENTIKTRPLPKNGVGLVQSCKGYSLKFQSARSSLHNLQL